MTLPLKVRLSIRQLWDPPDCPSQKALAKLAETLGRPISCDPDWAVLHASLAPFYTSDASQLVADATAHIQSWVRAAQDVLDDEDQQAGELLADKMLEAMSQSGVHRLQLAVDVHVASSSTSPHVQTTWDADRSCFVLLLPRGAPPHNPAAAVPALRSQIMGAFDADAGATPVDATDRDEWADVAIPAASTPTPTTTTRTARTVPAWDDGAPAYLPSVNTLPRPDELLLKPPYHLHVTQGSAITVQCSHSPSLSFLEAYFKKWCRTNSHRTDRPPMVHVTLSQSPFGLGPLHDTLTLEVPRDHYSGLPPQLSVPIVLHLVESVLEYKLVFSNASSWHYRRDTPIRQM